MRRDPTLTQELPNDKDHVLRKGNTLTQPYAFPNERHCKGTLITITHERGLDMSKVLRRRANYSPTNKPTAGTKPSERTLIN